MFIEFTVKLLCNIGLGVQWLQLLVQFSFPIPLHPHPSFSGQIIHLPCFQYGHSICNILFPGAGNSCSSVSKYCNFFLTLSQ